MLSSCGNGDEPEEGAATTGSDTEDAVTTAAGESTETTAASEDGGETAAGGDPVTVGMLTTLSGNAAYLGEDTQKGFELALQLAGADNIELVVEDDAQDPEASQQLAERMIQRDGAQIMTGIVFSDVAMAVVPEIVSQDMIYVSSNAGPSPLAGESCHENYFAASWQNDNPAEVVGQYALDQGFENVIGAAPNYQAGQDSVNGFRRTFGELQNEFYTELGATDYAQTIAQIRDEDPDAVYFFYPGGMGISFVQQYIESGLAEDIPIMGPTFSADETLVDAIGEAAVGLRNGSFWAPDLENPANTEFVEAYVEEYGSTPTNYSAQGYDTANLILSALEATGNDTSDTAALREAIRAADFESVRGDFEFGTNQHPIQDWHILEVVPGEEEGDYTNTIVEESVLEDHVDAYAEECAMGG
ncbi:MAG: ABC transporter substrate-binding protein [Acidimicrobiia bacterium]|nr:ABC transporter substrate-binding protein [Acidimicrobiia bacterium]